MLTHLEQLADTVILLSLGTEVEALQTVYDKQAELQDELQALETQIDDLEEDEPALGAETRSCTWMQSPGREGESGSTIQTKEQRKEYPSPKEPQEETSLEETGSILPIPLNTAPTETLPMPGAA